MSNLVLINDKQNHVLDMPQLQTWRYYVHIGHNPKDTVYEMAKGPSLLLASLVIVRILPPTCTAGCEMQLLYCRA